MDPKKIGQFICELRKEKNLSQYQLADMIPISRQGVSKWERGVTTPDTQTLIQLSELFNVSIDELLRGERSEDNSIEKLEETTLSILDQSNKKTKIIKRITTVSISIITILLLAFLSYYFINSYNSMEIYKVANTNDKFTTTDGIFIITSEKYYFKLGKIKNKIDAEINNIKIYYKKGKEKIVLVEDKEIDNIMIIDSYGYGEKFSKEDINKFKDKLYIEIDYNETEKVSFKLRTTRKYKNSSLFFLNQRNVGGKQNSKNSEVVEEKPIEEKKEKETKPTIQETETKKEEPKQEQPKEENKPQEQPPEPTPAEPEITTEQIINKIKETGTLDLGAYACYYDNYNYAIMYYEDMNRIEFYENFNLIGTIHVESENYVCTQNNCETKIDNIIKTYLLS